MFADFWTSYPRKIGKLDAEKAYAQMLKQGYEACKLVDASICYAEQVRVEKIDRKFVPYPATWLRSGRFLDEDLEKYRAPKFTADQMAEMKDRADQLMRRGKYAPWKELSE